MATKTIAATRTNKAPARATSGARARHPIAIALFLVISCMAKKKQTANSQQSTVNSQQSTANSKRSERNDSMLFDSVRRYLAYYSPSAVDCSLLTVDYLLLTVDCFCPYVVHRQLQKRLARPIARFNRISHLKAVFNGRHSFSALPPDRLKWAAFRSSNEHLEMLLSN